ncbi:MAG: hypothetical protein ABWZ40_11470 [Caulobacterales bacterium]
MIRFSPPSEFPDDSVPVAAGGPMKRSSSVSKRFLIAARSALESRKFAQSLFDVLALSFFALFVVLVVGAVGWSSFILDSAALK